MSEEREQVQMLPDGYKSICAVCGIAIDPASYPDNTRPFKTFSFGNAVATACLFGIVILCPTHLITATDPIATARAVLNRLPSGMWRKL